MTGVEASGMVFTGVQPGDAAAWHPTSCSLGRLPAAAAPARRRSLLALPRGDLAIHPLLQRGVQLGPVPKQEQCLEPDEQRGQRKRLRRRSRQGRDAVGRERR